MAESEILAKLRIKGGQRAIILDEPESYRPVIAAMPKDVELVEVLVGHFDFIHQFATKKADLERRAPELKAALKPQGILWVSYPKGKVIPTDLNRDVVREALEGIGLKAVAQVAIDDVWSALRFKVPEAPLQMNTD